MPSSRRSSGDDDFAPGGSEVRRQGPDRPEVLPPGRRNQDGPVRSPRRAATPRRKVTDPRPPEAASTALEEAMARVDEARKAPTARRPRPGGRLQPLAPPEPELEEEFEDEEASPAIPGGPMFQPNSAVGPERSVQEALELAQDAIMFAVRLRLLGEGEAGTWAHWDDLAINALMAGAEDPFDKASPAERFLYGPTGYLRTPEEISSADEIEDIINLGRTE